jgi:hypothetical protein
MRSRGARPGDHLARASQSGNSATTPVGKPCTARLGARDLEGPRLAAINIGEAILSGKVGHHQSLHPRRQGPPVWAWYYQWYYQRSLDSGRDCPKLGPASSAEHALERSATSLGMVEPAPGRECHQFGHCDTSIAALRRESARLGIAAQQRGRASRS